MEKEAVHSSVDLQLKKMQKETGFTEETVTILAPADTLYAFWLDLQNLKQFYNQIESITKISDKKSKWVWNALKGKKKIEWVSEIVEERRSSLIAWRAEGEHLSHSGQVEFVELDFARGTRITVKIAYDLPLGKMTGMIETLLGESPHRNLKLSLVQMRQLFEAGEIATVEGQSAGNSREHETKSALH
jgi:uncharacterized membrane protein